MKNRRYIKTIFIGSALLFGIGSCTNLVEDITSDPDLLLSEDLDSKNILQGVLLNNQFFQTSSAVRMSTLWMNQATGEDRQYIAVDDWNNTTAGDFDNTWALGYNTLSGAKDLQAKADAEFNNKSKGVGQVMEAYVAGTLASLFGDIPYSEFDYTGKNSTPIFDSQQDVYAQVQTVLDDAIKNLSMSGSINASKDVVYSGNANQWIKAANALKARFYLHVKDYPNAKLFAAKGMASPSDDLMAKFGNNYGQSFNPWYSFMVYDRPGYMTANDTYGVDLLNPASAKYRGNSKTKENARFNYTYLNDTNIYLGNGWNLNYFSNGDGWGAAGKFGSDTDMPLVSYGEMLLIKAEADARISGVSAGINSYNKYRQLLTSGYGLSPDYASMAHVYSDYVAADFNNGGIENPDGKTPVDALLREILEERYVYFIGSFESFTDFRRTNNIAGIQLKNYAGSAQRFLYGQSEINTNPNAPSPIPGITEKTPLYK